MRKILVVAALALPAAADAGFLILDDTAPPSASRDSGYSAPQKPQKRLRIVEHDPAEEVGGDASDEVADEPARKSAKKAKRGRWGAASAEEPAAEEEASGVEVSAEAPVGRVGWGGRNNKKPLTSIDERNPFAGSSTINVGGLKRLTGNRKTAIIHKGSKPRRMNEPIQLRGSAPLGDLLTKLIPDNFAIYIADSVDAQANMALSGGKNWVDALDATLVKSVYVVAIDWDSHEVVVAVDDAVKRALTPIREAKSEKVWEIRAEDGLLSDAINRWCQESGGECKKVVWQSSHDIPIETGASLTGEFGDALDAVMASVNRSSGHAFEHVLHKNGVLIINDGEVKK